MDVRKSRKHDRQRQKVVPSSVSDVTNMAGMCCKTIKVESRDKLCLFLIGKKRTSIAAFRGAQIIRRKKGKKKKKKKEREEEERMNKQMNVCLCETGRWGMGGGAFYVYKQL